MREWGTDLFSAAGVTTILGTMTILLFLATRWTWSLNVAVACAVVTPLFAVAAVVIAAVDVYLELRGRTHDEDDS